MAPGLSRDAPRRYFTQINIYLYSFHSAAYIYGALGGFGITAGAHRLWAHKAYKAKWQLRVILMLFNNIAFQNSIYEWVRDHR